LPQSHVETGGPKVCPICCKRINEGDEIMTYGRSYETRTDVAHTSCAISDTAARLKVFVAYGKRGARALR
jgi:hypothetical protein